MYQTERSKDIVRGISINQTPVVGFQGFGYGGRPAVAKINIQQFLVAGIALPRYSRRTSFSQGSPVFMGNAVAQESVSHVIRCGLLSQPDHSLATVPIDLTYHS